MKQTALRSRIPKGDCLAKAHISTAPPPPRKDARLPRAHEVQGRPQGAGGAPQEGTPSAHPRIVRCPLLARPARGQGEERFRAKRGWCGAENLMPFTAPGSAARVPTSPFSSAPTNCRRAVLDSASRRRWAARWCAIVSGGACARSCAATGRRYPQDGTSSYTQRVRQRKRRL